MRTISSVTTIPAVLCQQLATVPTGAHLAVSPLLDKRSGKNFCRTRLFCRELQREFCRSHLRCSKPKNFSENFSTESTDLTATWIKQFCPLKIHFYASDSNTILRYHFTYSQGRTVVIRYSHCTSSEVNKPRWRPVTAPKVKPILHFRVIFTAPTAK